MKRREFITLLGGAAVGSPLAARAQQAKVARVGFLGLVSASWHAARSAAFRAGLRELGWIEGRNIVIESAGPRATTTGCREWRTNWLVSKVDVLVTHGAAGALAAKRATSTIPIVVTAAGDFVALGLAESLSRPGGNITGLSLFVAELMAKRLELIKETVPNLG